MEIPVSTFLEKNLRTAEGKPLRISQVFIDPENGKVCGFHSPQGFLPVDQVRIKENEWTFEGTLLSHKTGDDWHKFRVENRRGDRRGRVTEIWIRLPEFQVCKFECAERIFWVFFRKRIFALTDIFEVLPAKRLIVVEEENRVFQAPVLPLENLSALSG